MRSGTLVVVIVANALIAIGVVAVALTTFPPAPASVDDMVSADARSATDMSRVSEKLDAVLGRMRNLEDQTRQIGQSQAALDGKMKGLEAKLADGAVAAVAAAPAPAADPVTDEEKAGREAMKNFARTIAAGARQGLRQVLDGIANPTEESIRQAEGRIASDARRIGRRLSLTPERVAQVEQSLLEVDRRVREKMRASINAKGIDNVTYEDAKPLIDESFSERESAMSTILSAEEMEAFKQQEAQVKARMQMGLRMAFPAKPPAEGESK
jgi:hypothetical protein